MANRIGQPAVLKILHSDILLVDDWEPAGGASEVDQVPATRPEEGSGYVLTAQSCTIGRNPDSSIRIRRERTDISRAHATVKREGDRFRLHDHSTRGTFVNDRRIEGSCLLDDGDVFGFGDSPRMLRFVEPTASRVALTAREHDILRLMVTGQTNKQIAAALSISPDTVNTHVGHIFEKLGVHTRTEAAVVAQTKGLLGQTKRDTST